MQRALALYDREECGIEIRGRVRASIARFYLAEASTREQGLEMARAAQADFRASESTVAIRGLIEVSRLLGEAFSLTPRVH